MNLVSFSPTFKLNFYLAKVRIRVRFDAMQNVVNQRKAIFRGGDVWNTRLLHLLLHQRRSWTALFCVFRENKKSRFSLKIRILRCFAFLCCGATGYEIWYFLQLFSVSSSIPTPILILAATKNRCRKYQNRDTYSYTTLYIW